jgi:hypothetical protein
MRNAYHKKCPGYEKILQTDEKRRKVDRKASHGYDEAHEQMLNITVY